MYRTNWVVYAKRPLGDPEQVFRHLGRYTHRVAISNRPLVSMDDRAVVFRTRGHDTASVTPTEFIGRFLLHILPSHFVKIRHFGLMASGNVSTNLQSARALLSASATSDHAPLGHHDGEANLSGTEIDRMLPWPELLLVLTGIDVILCPRCQQRTIVRERRAPALASPPGRKIA